MKVSPYMYVGRFSAMSDKIKSLEKNLKLLEKKIKELKKSHPDNSANPMMHIELEKLEDEYVSLISHLSALKEKTEKNRFPQQDSN
jgi:hypothetical protein